MAKENFVLLLLHCLFADMNPALVPDNRNPMAKPAYRGRLAPSPTGLLHLGHARTFWTAQQRARANQGTLVLRNDDLDHSRCRPEFVAAMIEDLRWFGVDWQEGPERGGPFTPYNQSERLDYYREALEKLRAGGFIFPCTCSHKDVRQAASAPNLENEEPVYPGTCRVKSYKFQVENCRLGTCGNEPTTLNLQPATRFSWRFRVRDGEAISFTDGNFGPQTFVAGKDFGDFVVWSCQGKSEVPAYHLACAVDDSAMQITEVVRGADLLLSTARQLLLYRALGWQPPKFFHCPLVLDENHRRLAKRHDAFSLRALRAQGAKPAELRTRFGE